MYIYCIHKIYINIHIYLKDYILYMYVYIVKIYI